MNRRHFLTGMAGILASASAPAIVTNPMKIWVPNDKLYVPTMRRVQNNFDGAWHETIHVGGGWHSVEYWPTSLSDGDLIVLSR